MNFLLIVTIFVYSVNADLYLLSDEAIKAINDSNKPWKAGKNFGESTSIDINRLVSTLKKSYHNNYFPDEDFDLKRKDLPSNFDARSAWPECPSIGKVYDQTKGVPSWVYPTVGQIADRLCIKYGIQIDVENTVKRMIKANGGFNSEYNSADIGQVFNYWAKKGIFTVQSLNETNCLPFSQCEITEIQLDKHFKVDGKYPRYLSDKMRDVMINGPLTNRMTIYEDFVNYKSGIYRHSSGKVLGTHVVKIIGWKQPENSDQRYWLVTNSWGEQWGENGHFLLELGSDQFGKYSYAVSASFQPSDEVASIIEQDRLFELA